MYSTDVLTTRKHTTRSTGVLWVPCFLCVMAVGECMPAQVLPCSNASILCMSYVLRYLECIVAIRHRLVQYRRQEAVLVYGATMTCCSWKWPAGTWNQKSMIIHHNLQKSNLESLQLVLLHARGWCSSACGASFPSCKLIQAFWKHQVCW